MLRDERTQRKTSLFLSNKSYLLNFIPIHLKNMNLETRQFIQDHLENDIHQLALMATRFPLVDIPLAIRQIAGKQKIKNKVPRFYHTEALLYPVQLSLEQSSSETTARYKASLCQGEHLVDLTGGFGVDCCFMAANFKAVTYVERNAELCQLAEMNFKALGEQHISVINAESEEYLAKIEKVDCIFMDPARRSSSGKKLVFLSDCEPDVSRLASELLGKAKQVMVKLSPMMDITAALRDLPQTSEVHILAVENECKEVLLLLDQSEVAAVKIKTINFGKNNQSQHFDFDAEQELNTTVNYSSELGKYLYEPNAAVMKSGAFKSIAAHFKLHKLHINTHLYSSSKLIVEFPGRSFEIIKQWDNGKNEWKNEAKKLGKANLTTRNYPLSVEELRKKLKISDGGEHYLFACTLANEQKVMIVCKKS